MNKRRWITSSLLPGSIVGLAALLALWKISSINAQDAAAASQPEPMEAVAAAVARESEHRPTTTAIGTVVALRSITLKNELAGTVRDVRLTPGQVVEAGAVLVALDVSVERAELEAQKAQTALAETLLGRVEKMSKSGAVSVMELDSARAQRDVALAQVARLQAIIDRKTIRAPFRAHVGIADVHPGQYLNEGTLLTTLQGVDEAAYVDFPVAQQVGAALRKGMGVEIVAATGSTPIWAEVVAVDAKVDPNTRNALVRARVADASTALAPGASVRVSVPVDVSRKAIVVPVSALRKGPEGDHVFILQPDDKGNLRAHVRRVRAGTVLGDEVVIESGVTAGERVAASGSFKLRESVLVAVADPAAAAKKI
jgi:membrane fusion protein (multidrug efflux system)